MRISCVICGELFIHSHDISATPCGHIFHTECVRHWFERSQSCPQCRTKAMKKTLKKLYLYSAVSDPGSGPDELQHQLDCMQLQLKLKEQEEKKLREKADSLQAQNIALREEYKALKKEDRTKAASITALKAQMHYVDRATTEAKKAKKEVKGLKEKLNLLEGVEKMLSGSVGEVETLVNGEASNPDGAKALASFCCALKQELCKALENNYKSCSEAFAANQQKKEAEKEVKMLQEQVDILRTMNREIKQDMESLEKENKSLAKKVNALEQAISSPSDDVRSSAIHRLLSESPAPALPTRLYSADNNSSTITPEVVRQKPSATLRVVEEDKEEEEEERKRKKNTEEEDLIDFIDLVTPPRLPKKICTGTNGGGGGGGASSLPLTDNINIMKGGKRYNHPYSRAGASTSMKNIKLQGRNVGYEARGTPQGRRVPLKPDPGSHPQTHPQGHQEDDRAE